MKYDVAVIGGGPAGSTAARILSENNLKVLLLEKYKLPRSKPCAGGLPYHLKKELPFSFDSAVDMVSRGVIFTYKYQKPVISHAESVHIQMVSRSVFDKFLIDKAIEKGAAVHDSVILKNFYKSKENYIIETDKGNYKSNFIIGSDGANSITRKISGLLKKRILYYAINGEVYVSDEDIRKQKRWISIETGAIPGGYGWIFPKSDHFSCGVGVFAKRKIKNLKKDFFNFLNSMSTTKNYKKVILKGHPLPISYKPELVINTDNLILTGDAACLVDGLSGEGIYYAVLSGRLAAEAILDRITNNVSLDNYSKIINTRIRSDLEYSNKFAYLYYKFPALVYKYGISNPNVNVLFQDLLVGKSSYKELYIKLKKKFTGKFIKGKN